MTNPSPDRLTERATAPTDAPTDTPTLRPEEVPPLEEGRETNPVGGKMHEMARAGDTLHGFHLLRELGRGSFARVFLARQIALDRLVALKVSPNRGQEARTLASLEHDHVVRVFSEEIDPGHDLRLMCMQYVPGTTLARIIEALHKQPPPAWAGQAVLDIVDAQSTDPVPLDLAALRDRERLGSLDLLETVCWMGARLAEALAYAHARGVLHRDIKPANILVNRYGRPLLVDFNVAAPARRLRANRQPPAHSQGSTPNPPLSGDSGGSDINTFGSTRAGTLAGESGVGGTIVYMAPEHIDAFNPDNFTPPSAVDARSDIFSLGVVLFEFLTGRLPFDCFAADSDERLLQSLADQRRAGPPPLDPGLAAPAMLERILARCMAGGPPQRYQSAADLAADLDSCRVMLRVQRQLPPGYVVTPMSLSSPFLVGGILVVLPHLIAGAVNFTYNFSRIVGHFSEEQKQMFWLVALFYNTIAYPITIALYLRLVLPLVRLWRQLGRPEPLDPAVVDRARRQALRLPWWGFWIATPGWVLGGVVFPLGIYLGSEISVQDAQHFLVSFTLSGLIAMTYSVIAIEFIVVRVLYPGLWLDARNLRAVAQDELHSTERRLVAWQVLAVLIPLIGAALMIRVGPETFDGAEYGTFRFLVTALLGMGMVGLGLALLGAGILRQTIAVLTGGRVRSARPAPRDTVARTSTRTGN